MTQFNTFYKNWAYYNRIKNSIIDTLGNFITKIYDKTHNISRNYL